jgi:hypothetical protein
MGRRRLRSRAHGNVKQGDVDGRSDGADRKEGWSNVNRNHLADARTVEQSGRLLENFRQTVIKDRSARVLLSHLQLTRDTIIR